MKFLLFVLLYMTAGLCASHAQGNDWFKGTWYGERTFPDARIAQKALMRMEVEEMHGELFSGQLIYMYPEDTTTRVIRKMGGQLYGRYVIINKSEEIYRADPQSRGLWSNCLHCPGASSFYIENGNLVLKIVTAGCGDSCNGETTFRRKMQDYNAAVRAVVIKKFGGNNAASALNSNTAASIKKARNLLIARDSIKYFPTLLNDSMGIHFDPNKYILPYAPAMDTTLVSKQDVAQNKVAKKGVDSSKKVVTKDSIVTKKDNVGNPPGVSKTKALSYSVKTAQKDTAQLTAKPISKTPANAQSPASSAISKDTLAAAPTSVKDTVPAAITQRTTQLINTYQVSSPHIAVQLFDDGQIDGDAVSVYYNGKLVISNQTLTHKAIAFNIEASATNRHHEFILISESEGFIPPNTALMRIKAGSQQFELNVSSSSARNAKIAIDYVGE